MSRKKIYTRLAEKMVDNAHDVIGTRSLITREFVPNLHVSGIVSHLTPTTHKRKRQDGSVTNTFLQVKCGIIKNWTKSQYTCSECS